MFSTSLPGSLFSAFILNNSGGREDKPLERGWLVLWEICSSRRRSYLVSRLFHKKDVYKRNVYRTSGNSHNNNFLTFLLLRSLSACFTLSPTDWTARVWTVGRTQTPTSSFSNLSWRLSRVRSKNFTVKLLSRKCFEHTAEYLEGFQCACFSWTKSTHFFLLFLFSGSSAPPFWFGVLLHPKTTQMSGIFVEQVVYHRADKRNPGMMSWIMLNPDPIWYFFHLVMFQKEAIFSYFEYSPKNRGFKQMKIFLRNLAQCDFFRPKKTFWGYRHFKLHNCNILMHHKEANRKHSPSSHCSLQDHLSYAHSVTGFPRWRDPGCKYKHYNNCVFYMHKFDWEIIMINIGK